MFPPRPTTSLGFDRVIEPQREAWTSVTVVNLSSHATPAGATPPVDTFPAARVPGGMVHLNAELPELAWLRALFGSLRLDPALGGRHDAAAADVARALAARARRRRAHFDLGLRHAEPHPYSADVALALRAQQGAREAVIELRRRLEPVIVTRIYALGLRRYEEELTEHAVARVWEKLGTYRGTASLTTWGARVTRNCLVNWLRSERVRERRTVPLPTDLDDEECVTLALHATPAPDLRLVADERDARLRNLAEIVSLVARETLSPGDWDLLQEIVLGEGSYAAVAAERGVRTGTLRVRSHRAVAKLRQAIADRLGEGFTRSVVETLRTA
jgi:RNA polymerase sigma-70 factor (ECF subfamily)